MTDAPYVGRDIPITIDGRERIAVLREPTRLAADPALLLALSSTRQTNLDDPPYRFPPDAFLAAGHRVVAIDLPNHGDQENHFGRGLDGMAAAAAAGVDPWADVAAAGRAVFDAAIGRGWVRPGRIVLSGVSRGGHSALHVMAADARVGAAAAIAPVTHLPALREFAHLADNLIVRAANALSLAPWLAGRPIYFSINEVDPRVDTGACRQLYETLRAAAPDNDWLELELFQGEGHGLPHDGYRHAGDWLLRCLDAHP